MAITVGELLEKLKDVDPDTKVIMEDSEYGKCPVKHVFTGFRYVPINSWHGEVCGETDPNFNKDESIPCIVLSSD